MYVRSDYLNANIYIYKCALPVHVCGGHVYFLLSIMTVHMCAYYICIIVLCITCVGHVSLSMCILLYIKSLVLCNKNFCGMLCTVYSCKLEYT
jgi:hypothetical protein